MNISHSVSQISRRDFMKTGLGAVGGLTLGVYVGQVAADDNTVAGPGEAGSTTLKQGLFEPNAFIRIGNDSTVTVLSKHLEMGQGTYTGLATLVAEELDADWSQMRTEGAPANVALYKNLAFGFQGTGGSSSIANAYLQMRQAGAAAKAMLIAAAAAKWQVPAAEISVVKGVVQHPSSKQQATFGDLAEAAQAQAVPEKVTLKKPEQFTQIGRQNVRRVDSAEKSTGKAQYTQDVQLPDMLTALVAHAPRFGSTVKDFNADAAKAIAGVVEVVSIPTGVAVIGKDFWSAKKGRDALQINWDDTNAYKVNSEDLMYRYQALSKKAGASARREGDADAALKTAHKALSASYEFPYLAHAAMEPLNCVVHIKEDGCEIWNGAQMQTLDQGAVAAILGIPPEKVTIYTLYAGGSFGRRANPHSDYIVEAAQIAKASSQRVPIKMVWTREDDMQAGYYRPMFYHTVTGGLSADGQLTAWRHRMVGQSIMKGTMMEGMIKNGVDSTSTEGAAEPYTIPNVSIELYTPDLVDVPIQWWRSVGHTHTGFVTECFIDELAHAAEKDPVAFRRAMLKEHPRHLAVLELAAEKAQWGSELPANRGRGIAVVESFNTYVAEVAEVTVNEDGSFSVDKVVVAVDCGVVVNPDTVYAQMGGGVGFGLSATLGEKITLKDGKVEQSNFHNYGVLRMNQMPQVEVHLVESTENPSGVGEPAVPPIAPAVANALFAVTGKRIYQLPIGAKV